jgi:hypothetical protein
VAKALGDTSPQLLFRDDGRDLELAVEQAVEHGANQGGTVDHHAGLVSHLGGEAIELHDLSIEQDHRDLGPPLGVDTGAPAGRFMPVLPALLPDALDDH